MWARAVTAIGTMVVFTIFGVTYIKAGTFHDEWPDAILCKIKGDADAERTIILYLSKFDANLERRCAGVGEPGNSIEASYYSVPNIFRRGAEVDYEQYFVEFCSETTVSDAKPWAIRKEFLNCKLDMTIEDLHINNQTRNF